MNKKEIKIISILVVVLIVTCGIFYGGRYFMLKDQQQKSDIVYVKVQYGNEIVGIYDISVDGVYEFTGDYGKLYLEIRDERYHVFDVDCPDHTCEGFGWVSKGSLTTISCLPNNIFIFQ